MPHSSRISFSADDLHAEELHGEADRLRREADACGNALERDKLLRRARSCDVAAEADRWVNSPGLTGPRPAENEKHHS